MTHQHNQERLAIKIKDAVKADAAQSPDHFYIARMLHSCHMLVHTSECKDEYRCPHCPRVKMMIMHYKNLVCARTKNRKACLPCSFLNEIFVFHARNCVDGMDCHWGPVLHCPEFKLLLVRSELQNGLQAEFLAPRSNGRQASQDVDLNLG